MNGFYDILLIFSILLIIVIPRNSKFKILKWFFWITVILNIGIRLYLVQLKNVQKSRINELEEIQSFIRDVKVHATIFAKTKKKKVGKKSYTNSIGSGGLNRIALFNDEKEFIFFEPQERWYFHQFKDDSIKIHLSYSFENSGEILGKPISSFEKIIGVASDFSMILKKRNYQLDSSVIHRLQLDFEINGVSIDPLTIYEGKPGQFTKGRVEAIGSDFFITIPGLYKQKQLEELKEKS